MADTQPPRIAVRQSSLPLFIAVLLIPAALGSSQTIFNDGDVSWHIATGPLDPRPRRASRIPTHSPSPGRASRGSRSSGSPK